MPGDYTVNDTKFDNFGVNTKINISFTINKSING